MTMGTCIVIVIGTHRHADNDRYRFFIDRCGTLLPYRLPEAEFVLGPREIAGDIDLKELSLPDLAMFRLVRFTSG